MLNLGQVKSVQCIKGQASKHACLNKKCEKYAFVCQDQECQCYREHKGCLMVKTKTIVDSLQDKIIDTKPMEKLIDDKFQEMIDRLSEQRDNLIIQIKERFDYCGLSLYQKQLVKSINAGQVKDITGSQLWKAHLDFEANQQILKQIKDTDSKINAIFTSVNEQLKQLFVKIMLQIAELQAFAKEQTQANEKIVTCKPNVSKKIGKDKFFVDSKVITKSQQVQTLCQFLGSKKIKLTTLIYRASENNFEVSKFFQKCLNIPHTVTVCQTQHKKIIGGYTPVPWTKTSWTTKTDESGDSFVFSVSNKDKFVVDKKENAVIHRNDSYSPQFGNQGDLMLCNKANQSRECYGRIGSNYKNPNYTKDQKESLEKFIGSSANSHKFKVNEWEVWRLQFC